MWHFATVALISIDSNPLILSLEGYSERSILLRYGLDQKDSDAVTFETGVPSGWFPLIEGYETLPILTDELIDIPAGLLNICNSMITGVSHQTI